MNTEPFREMLPKEKELIRKLLEPAFPGRDELSQQLETAKARTIDEDGGLEFSISSSTKADHVKHVVPTEGEYEDPDGMTVHVLLHLAGDKAKELEFFREDGSPVQSWPDVDSIRVFAPKGQRGQSSQRLNALYFKDKAGPNRETPSVQEKRETAFGNRSPEQGSGAAVGARIC